MKDVPNEVLLAIQKNFHAVIRERAGKLIDEHQLELPELALLLTSDEQEMWFDVPGMYGGFSYWLAGAGIRGGRSYGATDAIGLRASENKVHVRDFHATLLHLLGLDYERLSFFHSGLEERLTGPTEARVIREVLA